jgi:hypothetical protein
MRAAWRARVDAESASQMREAADTYARALSALKYAAQGDRSLVMIGPGAYITMDGKYEVSAEGDRWYVIDTSAPVTEASGDGMRTLAQVRDVIEQMRAP